MDARIKTWSPVPSRALGVLFGLGTQLCFAVTVWRLFWYLYQGGDTPPLGSPYWELVDLLLAVQFAVVHSMLLLPATRARIAKFLPSSLFGTLFCAATCGGLWLVFDFWQTTPQVAWDLHGTAAVAMQAGFFASWAALVYSLSLTGFGYQTGWTQWRHWLRRERLPLRRFAAHGAYRWLRHPVYLSFLGLIWFTPRMTLDHALLTGIWTVYIFVGSVLKDRRLIFYLGDEYRAYAARVSGYPGMFVGPLSRLASPTVNSTASPANSVRRAA